MRPWGFAPFLPGCALALIFSLGNLSAQEAEIPVARPESVPATPPVALPVETNAPPIAPPASVPATPPVAQPVEPVQPPVAPPASVPTKPPVALPVETILQPAPTPVAPAPPPAPVATQPTPAVPAPGTSADIVITTPAAVRFEAALALYDARQYAEAVTAFFEFVRDFPDDRRREEALYRLAESYRNVGRLPDALAAYTYQVTTYPEGPLRSNAELRRGAILFDQGKYADAIPALEYVANQGDGQIQQAAKYLFARSLIATGKEQEGRLFLQLLIEQKPPGSFAGNAAQSLAELEDSENHAPEAFSLWSKAVALSADPGVQATAAARGGWSAIAANQPAEAERLFKLARQLDPNGDARKVATTGLLRLLFQQKRYAEWLAIYGPDKDRLLASAHPEVVYDLGQVQFSLKHWAEAVPALEQYLAEFPNKEATVTIAYQRFLAKTQVDPTKTAEEAAAYLQNWPQSPWRVRVQLLLAQELAREKHYAEALPLWEALAREPEAAGWPHQQILLELARTYDQMADYPKAAAAYQTYLDHLNDHPLADPQAQAKQVVQTQARLAICLQKANQPLAAMEAWKVVQSLAPGGTPEQQMALESLGLIYARGGPAQADAAVKTFRLLLKQFPESKLRAVASFTVGESLFRSRDYAGAEPYLLRAREADPASWAQPVTQRLVLGAYGMKNYDKTVAYLKQYEALPPPTDPQAQAAARLPAGIFYWLAEVARKDGRWADAETWYTRVTQSRDPGDLLAGAWWQLGEVQSAQKKWKAAMTSYGKYCELKPESKDATTVILARGHAALGAGDFDEAKKLGDKALLQEPEGPNSATARMLLGEIAYARKDYPEAAKMFATLALIFEDPKVAPQAIARAAEAYEKAGNAKSATEWKAKLKELYPGYQATSYL